MISRVRLAFLLLLASFFASVNSYAALDLSSITVDMSPIETFVLVLMGAIGVIWVARKAYVFFKKS